jgi:hypothetical protein
VRTEKTHVECDPSSDTLLQSAITFSPRLATGNKQPLYSDDVKQVETLSSSVTAQSYDLTAVCRNCTTWSTGSLDTTSTSQSFMFALGPTGNSIASDSTSQDIKKHSMYKTFTFDMPQASFTGNSIPSLVGSSTSGESQEAPAEGSGPSEVYNRVHGIFMAIAFVIIFPLGVIFLRVMNNVILHGLTQALGYAFVIVGLGTGIVLSQGDYNSAHQIIGLVLFSLLAIQALGGLIHHLMYKRTGKPTIIGKVHVVLGICLLILGIVNTPLGLNLAHDSHYNKYYIIVVSILGALFLAVRFWKIWDNRKKAKKGEAKEGYAAETGMTQLSSH